MYSIAVTRVWTSQSGPPASYTSRWALFTHLASYSCYNISDCIPHAACHSPVTVTANLYFVIPSPFSFSPTPFLSGNRQFDLCLLRVCVCLVWGFGFHIQVKSHGMCLSLPDLFHLAQYHPGPSKLLQIVRFHSLLWLSHIALYTCTRCFPDHPPLDPRAASTPWLLYITLQGA